MSNIFDLFKKIETESASVSPVSFLVVGLGNPGSEYVNTRHNAGFLTLDYIAERVGCNINRAKFDALYGEAQLGGARVLLIKPQTYMNNSGTAVHQFAEFYKIPTDHIIVVSDDISLPVGRMRVRRSGSDGGQRGLKSIIYHLNSDAFPRIKMGVGEKPNPEYDLAAWVLSKFTESEQKTLFEEFGTAMSGIEKIISGDVDGAMMLCNTNKAKRDTQ